MNRERAKELLPIIEAFANGADVEFRDYDQASWKAVDLPLFGAGTQYRIAPRKPSINWDHVADKWKWLTIDESDQAYVYELEPRLGADSWTGGMCECVMALASFDAGNCEWQDSLVKRPES